MVCGEDGMRRFVKVGTGIISCVLLVAIPVAIVSFRFDGTSPTIQELRRAGFLIQGQDPCAGSELCCDLLPANNDSDVHYVTLPNKAWDRSQLLKLKRFTNIQQVRADRDVTIEEYELLRTCVVEPRCILVNMAKDSGGRWTGDYENDYDDEHDDE